MKKLILFLLVWLGLSGIGYVIGSLVFEPSSYERLALDGLSTYGQVVSKDEVNHRTVQYRYSVDSVAYNGSGHSGEPNPEFDAVEVDDELLVFYDPADPTKSMIDNPWGAYYRNRMGVWCVTVVLPVLPLFFLAFGLRLRREIKGVATPPLE